MAGAGHFVAGHFGEWLQGRAGGEVALVTMACPVRGARAEWRDADGLAVSGGVIDPDRCRRFLGALGLAPRGRVRIAPDLPPGGGAGMSTAALVALARAAGADPARVAAACLLVEGATDPLMLPRPDAVLWAPRRARAIGPMPPPPRAEILGGFWGPVQRTDPADRDFPAIDDLVAAWAAGPDLPGAARLAACSARRTTALRGPAGDPTAALARALGALGHARAHTGPARALIFAPGTVPDGAEAALASAGYRACLRFQTGERG